jgi:hypothetical protein
MGSRAALVIATFLMLGFPEFSEAETTVANLNDEGPGSLRQAVEDALPGETISLPAGTYTLASGEISIDKSLTIAGHGAGDTIVRSGGPFRVFSSSGAANEVAISGVTIRDGHRVDAGGGVWNQEATLTLSAVVVTGNVASADGEAGQFGGISRGGGIYNQNGTLHLLDSTVTANRSSAVGGSGKFGGIAYGGGISSEGAVTVERSNISSNIVDARGGQGPSDPMQFGGISTGGGIYASVQSTASLSASTVSGNLSDASSGPGGFAGIGKGGGVYFMGGTSPFVISRMTVSGNEARGTGGGGIIEGGGIYFDSGVTTMTVSSTTVAGNAVDSVDGVGGNLRLQGISPPSFESSIVSGGRGPTGSENCASAVTSAGFNLESADQCGFGTPGDQVNQDPQLGPLQDNGGPTRTMALAATSPAVDQGSAPGQLTDQRGVLRPIDFPAIPNPNVSKADGSDIGAFELQPSNALVLGKLRRNKKKGTATLVVRVPVPANGTVVLFGKGLRKKSKAVADSGVVKLPVVGRRKVKRALRRRGKRKILIKVSYTPTGNEALTKSRKVKLLRRHRKPKQR